MTRRKPRPFSEFSSLEAEAATRTNLWKAAAIVLVLAVAAALLLYDVFGF